MSDPYRKLVPLNEFLVETVGTEQDESGNWLPIVRSLRKPPPRYSATSKQGRSTTVTTYVPIGSKRQDAVRKARRKAAERQELIDTYARAGIELPPSLRTYI